VLEQPESVSAISATTQGKNKVVFDMCMTRSCNGESAKLFQRI
jgi:hypothetical protein